MSRRRRKDELPTVTEMLRETGYGWIMDLARLLVLVVLVGGGFAFVYYVTVSGLTDIFHQVNPRP